jgi:phage putative head morphogenesis protein, SPP1 gp7 family
VESVAQQLLGNQLEEIQQQGKKVKNPKPVDIPKAAGIQYNAELQRLVRAVRHDINTKIVPMIKALEPLYVSDSSVNDGWADQIMAVFIQLIQKWSSPSFIGAANQVAGDFVSNVNRQNQRRFLRGTKAVGIDVFGDSQALQDLLEASTLDNARLITTIPSQYLNQVQSIVMTNMRSGLLPRNIIGQLRNQFGVTQRRAALIARDQTSKVNGEINKARQTSAGFEFFKWETAEDSRVRDDHEEIAKADVGYGPGVYRWDDPPKDDKGQKIIPGSAINCRCVAIGMPSKQVKSGK